MIKQLTSIVLLFVSFRLSAQQSFDILSYTVPPNWNQQKQSNRVTLEKTLSIKNPCSIIMHSSEPASRDGKQDFNNQWIKYVKKVYSVVNDSITIETQRVGEWVVYSTTSTCTVNNREASYIFNTLVSGTKIISIIAIISDELCLEEINNFYTTLEAQGATEKRKGVIKKARIKFRLGKIMKETSVPKTN